MSTRPAPERAQLFFHVKDMVCGRSAIGGAGHSSLRQWPSEPAHR